jgi:hypothetical protein
MKKLSIFFLILASLSCKKAVEVEPVFDIPEDQAVRTVADLEVVVNGAYQSLANPNAYGSALKLFPDIISDMITINTQAVDRGITGASVNVHIRQMYGSADGVWRECYNAINRANVVIEAFEQKKVVPQTKADSLNLNRIVGEAYFLRGLLHFELVRFYGLQYGINQNEANSGVLVRTTPTRGRYTQARNTTQEVYNQAISDLKTSISLLPEQKRPEDLPTYNGLVGGRAARVSAQAILARVYFQMASNDGDDGFLEAYNQITPSPETQMNFDSIFVGGSGKVNYWSKFGYQIAPSTYFQIVNLVNPITNEASSTIKTLLDSYSYAGDEESAPFPTIFGLNSNFVSTIFSNSPTDSRFTNGLNRPGSTIAFSQKYTVDAGRIDLNVPVIRAAELVLGKAEILATRGDLVGAADLVLALRNRNYSPSGTEVANLRAMDQNQLLLEIRKERNKELFTEGDRLHHFRRFAQRHKIPGTLSMNFTSSTRISPIIPIFEFDKKSCLFKIPDAEIAVNSAVINN